jgi:hypothetical protein
MLLNGASCFEIVGARNTSGNAVLLEFMTWLLT